MQKLLLFIVCLFLVTGCKKNQLDQEPKWTKEDLEDMERMRKFRENSKVIEERNWEILEEKNNKQYKRPVKIHLYCCSHGRDSIRFDYRELYEL